MEQKPTVGRIVHYHPPTECVGPESLCTYAAIISQVNPYPVGGIETVELATFGPNSLYFQHNVPFSDEPKPGHWNWPPRV